MPVDIDNVYNRQWGFPLAVVVKNPLANAGRLKRCWVPSLGRDDPLEEGMATHPSILAWRISWTEEPGGLQSWGRKESDTTEATEHAHEGDAAKKPPLSMCV